VFERAISDDSMPGGVSLARIICNGIPKRLLSIPSLIAMKT